VRRQRKRPEGGGRGTRVRAGCVGAALLLLAGCGGGEARDLLDFGTPRTAIQYEADLEGAPSDEIGQLMRESLAVFRRREDGAQSVAFLRRRAQGDRETAQTILRSRGYYAGEVTVSVEEGAPPPAAGAAEGGAADDPAKDGTDTEPAEAAPPARVTIRIRPGPQYTLSRHGLLLTQTGGTEPPALDAAALGSPVGAGAEAAAITAAERAAVQRLRREGRPYAEFAGRDAVADPEAATLEVESTIRAGPHYRFGAVSFEGVDAVDPAYLATYVPWDEGAVFSSEAVGALQEDLAATGLFRGVSVSPPDAPPLGDAVPIEVSVEEAPFRTAGASLRFSTDEGPEGRLFLEHRNLFGANEQLFLELDAGLERQLFGAAFLKPQFLRPGQDLTAGFELRRIDEDRFEELGTTLTLGLQRALGERWTVGAGGLLEASLIDDEGDEKTALLAGLPVFARYDGSDDELNPTTGQRLRLKATPFIGQFDEELVTFLRLEARASAYQDLSGDGRWVLAERARIGSIVSDSLADVPPTRRFYSGGGGSVRGFAEDAIGPLDMANDPAGGRSVGEAGIELRAPIWGDLGGVVFVEGGIVTEEPFIDGSEDFLVAAGAGLRYYSPVGPIRIDAGFPLNGRDVDDGFQVYFSIGQAF
jgi:translocation and assembly module TamA